MVVNKKSRQQMHEDLHLFLENNTAPFVEWLHDQVLKKLQKVTIAKKKVSREFVPAVIIKQKEQRKKHKTTTSFLDDHNIKDVTKKLLGKPLKEDKDVESEPKSEFPNENKTECQQEKKNNQEAEKTLVSLNESENVTTPEQSSSKSNQPSKTNKSQESENLKTNETPEVKIRNEVGHPEINTSTDSEKRPRTWNEEENLTDPKKVKSSITKPKITSVVSVKNRLGIISPQKKLSDSHIDKEIPKHKHERITTLSKDEHEHTDRRNNFSRIRNIEFNDDSRKNRTREKTNDIKNRLGGFRDNKTSVNQDNREKITEKCGSTIKNRLGTSIINRTSLPSSSSSSLSSSSKKQEIQEERRIDNRHERNSFRGKNVKYRLGPMRKIFRPNDNRNLNSQDNRISNLKDNRNMNLKDRNSFRTSMKSSKNGNFSNMSFDDDDDDVDEDDEGDVNVAPVKSHIVAVQRPSLEKSSRKRLKSSDDVSDDEEEEVTDCKLSSKVIVTPRPLKPLLSTQKRATQSLLLRAVAEANQSVVSQKNPEPSLVVSNSRSSFRRQQ